MRTIANLTCAAMLCLAPPVFATSAFAKQAGANQAQPEAEAPPQPSTTEQMLETARLRYAVRSPRADPCPPEQAGVIVVCRRLEDPESQRVPGTIDQAIAAGAAVNDGLPRAPDLMGIPDGGVSVGGGCFVPPCPPPAAIMIDLKALPEPPPGSDAASYGYQPPPAPGSATGAP